MFAARQRAGYLARQLQRPARSYASDAHGHHAPDAPVNESFGVWAPSPREQASAAARRRHARG